MEGIRVRKTYELAVKTTGVHWEKRGYKTEGWDQADPVNQASYEVDALLCGLCQAAAKQVTPCAQRVTESSTWSGDWAKQPEMMGEVCRNC